MTLPSNRSKNYIFEVTTSKRGGFWGNFAKQCSIYCQSPKLDTASIDLVKCSDSLGNMGGGSLVVDGEEVREDLATVKCLVPSLNF